MDFRNIQKTGNMHYVYLPSKWCRDKNITTGSRVELDIDNTGKLIISATRSRKPLKDIKLDFEGNNLNLLRKLIVSCFINPVKSFRISLNKKIDQKEIIHDKKLMQTTFIEVDQKGIYSEPYISINNPLSLFISQMKKVMNLIQVILHSNDREVANSYEEEIDRMNILINKTTISALLHKADNHMPLVELHNISKLSNYLERMTDHLIQIETITKDDERFLNEITNILDKCIMYFEQLQEKNKVFDYQDILSLLETVQNLTLKKEAIREILIKTNTRHLIETMLDWAITKKID